MCERCSELESLLRASEAREREMQAKLEEAKADAKLCRGAMAAQEAMIQNALQPLGCGYPFDHHAAEWAADQIEGLKSERDADAHELCRKLAAILGEKGDN